VGIAKTIVELIFWVQIFLCPTAILGGAGFFIYIKYPNQGGIALFVLLSVLGAGLGIYFAERIRRNVGCSVFMSGMFSSSEERETDK
jgi:hypothetical protein